MQVEVTRAGERALGGVRAGTVYGTENMIGPVLYADDPEARTLGTLYGYDRPGLVVKKTGGARSYYSSAPTLPAELLRAIAARAGVHIYNASDDVTYVNRSFVAVHAPRGGKRVLCFRRPESLYDVYAERQIARRRTKVTLDVPARETVLYFRGNAREWQRARAAGARP